MNIKIHQSIRFIAVNSLLLASLTLSAAEKGTTWFGDTADGEWLLGIKVGQIDNDSTSSTEGFGTAQIATLVLGYQFSRPVGDTGSSSVELELGESYDSGQFGAVGEWDASTIGLYINYRTAGTVYFKTKLGFLKSHVDTKTGTVDTTVRNKDAAFSYGLGLGVLLGQRENVNLEIEWVGTSGDNNLNTVNLGGQVRF